MSIAIAQQELSALDQVLAIAKNTPSSTGFCVAFQQVDSRTLQVVSSAFDLYVEQLRTVRSTSNDPRLPLVCYQQRSQLLEQLDIGVSAFVRSAFEFGFLVYCDHELNRSSDRINPLASIYA